MTVRELLEAQGLDPQAVLDLELGGRRDSISNYAEAHLVDGYLNIEVSLSPPKGAHKPEGQTVCVECGNQLKDGDGGLRYCTNRDCPMYGCE